MQDKLKKSYANVLSTVDGFEVFKDLLEKFEIASGVYQFQGDNNLSDLAFRDGQRNAGRYIYNSMISANPIESAKIIQKILIEQSEKVNANE